MATPKKAPAKSKGAPKAGAQAPLSFSEGRPLYALKLGSVQVPIVEEGKGSWVTVTQGNWTRKHQDALFAYWNLIKADNEKFDIEAKIQKLFIVPATTAKAAAPAAEESEEEEEIELDADLQDEDPKS